MNKKMIFGSLIASTILQAAMPALAQSLPLPLPPPPIPSQSDNEGSLLIRNVARKAGGTWYRISVRRPIGLQNLEIRALSSRLKIYQGNVVLENGQRINIREYQNTAVFSTGEMAISESLNNLGRVVAIDLLLESYGGGTDIQVRAISTEGRVLLSAETAPTPVNASCRRGENVAAVMDSFDSEMTKWSQRKASYYSGTAEYNFADSQVKLSAQKLVSVAQSEQARTNPLDRLESLATKYTQKMGNYYSGTTEYNAYRDVATSLFGALTTSFDISLACEGLSTKAVLALADSFTSKRGNYYSGTAGYNGFTAIAKKAYASAVTVYEREVQSNRSNFSAIDADLVGFITSRGNYYSGTDAYNAYGVLTAKAAELSENDFRRIVGRLNADERFSYMTSFNNKKANYYSGTPAYDHFERMKNIAINGR